MREEVHPCIAQQKPVKESDIEGLEPQKHDDESQEELPEAKAISDAVPRADCQRAAHERKRQHDHPPAHGALAGKAPASAPAQHQ